ncbi:DsbA family protein [Patescibacteria group bacterium]|nr:DsbA family protein [Patescibacteria group bacterium]
MNKYFKLLAIVSVLLAMVILNGCDSGSLEDVSKEGGAAVLKDDTVNAEDASLETEVSDVNENVVAEPTEPGKVEDSANSAKDSGEVDKAQPTPDKPVAMVITEGFLGSKDAPITLVEYSDYECPYCGKFATETLPLIKKNYVNTGKVKYVFKDLPLPFHKHAALAAEAARCAGKQGKFYEMHDEVFASVAKWAKADEPNDEFVELALKLSLNGDDFGKCLDDHETKAIVDASAREAQELGINGTPSFVVNGYFVSGALPYETWQQIFDKLIEESK